MPDAPNQIYHTSGTPPLIYYKGKAYIGGSVSYDRTVPIAAQGYLWIRGKNEITDLIGTIDNS